MLNFLVLSMSSLHWIFLKHWYWEFFLLVCGWICSETRLHWWKPNCYLWRFPWRLSYLASHWTISSKCITLFFFFTQIRQKRKQFAKNLNKHTHDWYFIFNSFLWVLFKWSCLVGGALNTLTVFPADTVSWV